MNRTHWLMCEADCFAVAQSRAHAFLASSMLLRYDTVSVVEGLSCSADTDRFWPALEEGIKANMSILRGLVDDLQAEGCRMIAEVPSLAMGYPSKLLHIIAHFVDGFIGIDSVFYNLEEDSHWLSDRLRETIQKSPERYWLVWVEARFPSMAAAALIHQVPKE